MATGGLIGALRVTLGLDSANFDAGTKRARQTADATSKDIQKKLSGISTAIKGFATGAIVTELVAAGKRALDYASSLGEVAAQLGVTTDELQEFRYAATQTGVEQDQMDKGLQKLTKTIGEAHAGSKAAAQVFRDLDVSIYDGKGNVISAGVAVDRISDALTGLVSPAERAKREVEFFGKVGQELEPLLKEGSGAIRQLRQDAHDLGIVLNDSMIAKADDAADKMAKLNKVLEARLASVVSENANAIVALGDALAAATVKAGQFFQTMEGVKRIKRDEGWLAGMLSGPGEQLTASDPAKYVAQRTRELNAATAARRKAEQRDASGMGWGVRQAKRDEQEALRLLQAARNDPAFKAALANARMAGKKTDPGVGGLPEIKEDDKKKGGSKSSGPSDADRAANQADEMRALADEYLNIQTELSTDLDERRRLEELRLANGRAAYAAEIDEKVKKGELSKAAGDELKAQNEHVDLMRAAVIYRRLDAQEDAETLATKQEGLKTEADLLRIRAGLARTAGERRDIELRLLDIQFQQERLQLEALEASKDATPAEKEIARRRLAQLDQLKAAETEGVIRNTMGPGEQYLDSLTKTAGQANEQLQAIGVEGLKTLNDGLADAIIGAGSVTEAFENMADRIIGSLAQIAIEQALIKPLAQTLFGGESSGGGGGIFGSILSVGSSIGGLFGGAPTANQTGIVFQGYKPGYGPGTFGGGPNPDGSISLTSLPRFAKGGAGVISGLSGIDRNILSLNGSPIARVGKGELLSVMPSNDGGGRIAQIVPSPLFEVVIDGRAAGVAAPMAARAANAGSQGAQIAAARKQSRVIP